MVCTSTRSRTSNIMNIFIFSISFYLFFSFSNIIFCVFLCTYTDIEERTSDLITEDSSVHMQSIRGRKGWGDRSVGHVLAAIDERRTLPFHRLHYLFSFNYIL